MKVKITGKITPQGKKIFKELQKLAKLRVKVGFTAEGKGHGADDKPVTAKDYEDGPTIVEVAVWNEFGTYNIPERPFIRQSVEKNVKYIKAMCDKQLELIAGGKTDADTALRTIGAMQVWLMQQEIVRGEFTENAPFTIHGGWMKNQKSGKLFYVKGKDSSTPLVDTGHMRESIHYDVKPREG